ncbi:TOM (translocase of outer membrane) complex component [Paramecium bursaria]
MSGKIKSVQPQQAQPNPSIIEQENVQVVDHRQKQLEPQIKLVQSDINNSQFFNSKINGLSQKIYKHFDIQLPQQKIDLLESTYKQSQNLQDQKFQSQQIIQFQSVQEAEFTFQIQCQLHKLDISKFCINKFCSQLSRIICQNCELEELHNQDINSNLQSNTLFKIQIPQVLKNCQKQQEKIYDQCLIITQLTLDRLVEDVNELQFHLDQMKAQINLLEQRFIHRKYEDILDNPDLLSRLHEDYLYKLFTHDPLKQIDIELEGYQESYQLVSNKLKQILENNNNLSKMWDMKIQALKKEYQYQEKQIKLDNLCHYYKHQNYIASEVLLSENHNDRNQVNYNLAYVNYKQNKFTESLEYLEKVEENQQYRLGTRYLRGRIYIKQYQLEAQNQQNQKQTLQQSIVTIFNSLIQFFPQFSKAQYTYSKFLLDIKDYNLADQVIQRSISPKSIQLKALIEDLIGKEPQEILPLYDKCLKLDFKNILSYYKKGQLYIRLKQYEQALEMMDQVLIMDPRVWHALYYKCLIYGYYLSQFDQCLDCSNEGKLKFPQQKLFDKIYGINLILIEQGILKDHKQKSAVQ